MPCSTVAACLVAVCCCAEPVDSSLETPMHCCSTRELAALLPCAAVQNQLTKALCHCTYIHSANRCAVTKHQCPAAGFTAESMPCCCAKPVDSSLVTPIHCCSVQGNLHALLPCAAVQTQLTKALCHCTYIHSANGCAVTKHQCPAAGFTAESMPCCCAKPVDSSLVTPIHCCSVQGNLPALLPCAAVQNQLTKALCHCTYSHSANRCAVTKHQCPAAGFTAESMPCCCAKPVDSSLVTPMHCCSVQGNLHALLPCAAVQNQLTKALCHCIYIHSANRCAVTKHQCPAAGFTAESMPCCCAKPVDSSLVTPIHCCSVQGNLHALLPCAAVQNQLTKALSHCI